MTTVALAVTQMDHKTSLNITLTDTPGVAANAGGNTVPNGGKTLLVLNNTDTNPASVTIAYGTTFDGQTIPAITLTIPASKVHQIPLGPPPQFGQNTLVTAPTTVKLAAYAMP